MSISARNHLKGTITDLKLGDVMAYIIIKVGQNVCGRSTSDPVRIEAEFLV